LGGPADRVRRVVVRRRRLDLLRMNLPSTRTASASCARTASGTAPSSHARSARSSRSTAAARVLGSMYLAVVKLRERSVAPIESSPLDEHTLGTDHCRRRRCAAGRRSTGQREKNELVDKLWSSKRSVQALRSSTRRTLGARRAAASTAPSRPPAVKPCGVPAPRSPSSRPPTCGVPSAAPSRRSAATSRRGGASTPSGPRTATTTISARPTPRSPRSIERPWTARPTSGTRAPRRSPLRSSRPASSEDREQTQLSGKLPPHRMIATLANQVSSTYVCTPDKKTGVVEDAAVVGVIEKFLATSRRSLDAVLRIAVRAIADHGGYAGLRKVHLVAFTDAERAALLDAAASVFDGGDGA